MRGTVVFVQEGSSPSIARRRDSHCRFVNPLVFLFDLEMEEQGIREVKHSIPYADITDLPKEQLEQMIKDNHPLEFGHRLEDQSQGQIDAGFVVTGFYEDHLNGKSLLDIYINTTAATKAVKLRV